MEPEFVQAQSESQVKENKGDRLEEMFYTNNHQQSSSTDSLTPSEENIQEKQKPNNGEMQQENVQQDPHEYSCFYEDQDNFDQYSWYEGNDDFQPSYITKSQISREKIQADSMCVTIGRIWNSDPQSCLELAFLFGFSQDQLIDSLSKEQFQQMQNLRQAYSIYEIKQSATCSICYQDKKLLINVCGHNSCQKCWTSYFSEKLILKSQFLPKCHHIECQANMSIKLINYLLEKKENKLILEKFNNLVTLAYLNLSKNFMRCPNQQCQYIFNLKKQNKLMQCICCTIVCKDCGDFYHAFLSCDQVREWRQMQNQLQKKLTLQQQYQKTLNMQTRECPNCKSIIEKTYGCHHMTCICKYQFCWDCQNPWKDHTKCTPMTQQQKQRRKRRYMKQFGRGTVQDINPTFIKYYRFVKEIQNKMKMIPKNKRQIFEKVKMFDFINYDNVKIVKKLFQALNVQKFLLNSLICYQKHRYFQQMKRYKNFKCIIQTSGTEAKNNGEKIHFIKNLAYELDVPQRILQMNIKISSHGIYKSQQQFYKIRNLKWPIYYINEYQERIEDNQNIMKAAKQLLSEQKVKEIKQKIQKQKQCFFRYIQSKEG